MVRFVGCHRELEGFLRKFSYLPADEHDYLPQKANAKDGCELQPHRNHAAETGRASLRLYQAQKLAGVVGEAGEDGAQVAVAQVLVDDFAQDAAIVCGECQVAALI